MDPSQVDVRRAQPEDAAGIARVQIDGWRATYVGIMPDELLAKLRFVLENIEPNPGT